uniref:PGG domain-containing protein n=1 Tax=Leersia perrieri TaxID=77586 RepID=A0A0D9XWT3_9ORYZ
MVDGDAEQRAPAAEEAEFLWELRKYVLLLAMLGATVTYTAGLDPPGGFWTDNDVEHHHLAGDPILQATYPHRYKAFFYCNATSFVASVVIVNLLLVRYLCRRRWWLRALQAAMILDMFGLMGAYAAGSSREAAMSAYIVVLVILASLTYEAGMNPPGGFWQEGKSGHVGDPVLNNGYYRRRYLAFFFCNGTAFVASLAIIMLLVNRKLSTGGIRSYALRVCVILDLVGLMGAFAAGSCRKVKTSIYVFVLVFAVLLCIAFQVALVVSKSLRNLTNKLLSKLGAAIEDDAAGDRLPHTAGYGEVRDLWDEKLPKYLLLIAALAAAVTYQAAMNPPGGLWDDGQTAHIAGDPVLLSSYPRRYKVFFYCNATSFMASRVIMVLLLIKRVSNTQPALLALHAAMILDLFGLMGAYAAGSCRRVTTSAYILALLVGVSAYIVVLVVVSIGVARWMKKVMNKVGEKLAHCFSFEDL